MAMNSTTLATAILNHIKTFWGHGEPGSNPDGGDYWMKQLATAIAVEVVNHITGNARCSGTDSGGNTHSNVAII